MVEEVMKPPRRISEAPSARNLKPRRISAVRRWPPGCGRFPSPPPSPLPPVLSDQPPAQPPDDVKQPHATSDGKIENFTEGSSAKSLDDGREAVARPNGNLLAEKEKEMEDLNDAKKPDASSSEGKIKNVTERSPVESLPNGNLLPKEEKKKDVEMGKEEFSNKRWMNSKVYPPPKRRAVSAIRRYPPGCGRDSDFCLGLIEKPLEIDNVSLEINHLENENENQIENKNENAQVDPIFENGVDEKTTDEAAVPVQEKHESTSPSSERDNAQIMVNEQSAANDWESKARESRVQTEETMENCAIREPKPGEVVTDEKSKGKGVVRMNDVPVVHSTISEQYIVDSTSGDSKKKKKPVRVSHIRKPKLELVTMSNSDRPDAEMSVDANSQPSKEIVVFSESKQPMCKNGSSKGKERVFLKKKVVARKSVSSACAKLGENFEDTTSLDKDTMLVPFEDATLDPSSSDDAIILSQIRPLAYAGPSRPVLSKGKTKKKERRVVKKSTRPIEDDSESNMLTAILPPLTPSDGDKPLNARGTVKRTLRIFQMVCRMILQKEESGSSKQPQKGSNRIDLKAAELVKKSNAYIKPGNPVVGHVPGVEIGDEFRYRVELHLIGLHRPPQSGIDWTKVNGMPIATSIVASGGYSDGMDGSDVLIYTGSGGKPSGKKGQRTRPEDQKLENGNLALKNSMERKSPVRVIHGLKDTSDTKRGVMTFIYDGLYLVEKFWDEPEKYKIDGEELTAMVFKFKLRRMPGQPELGLHKATKSKKSKVREGLCVADISHGMEKIPVCAINTIDDARPPKFNYITSIVYPTWYKKIPPKGCDCVGRCASSKRCSCAVKNGGEIPFNFNGAIVHAKPLMYECGPSCRCPPSCHNRVSQNGIRTPLEIFKTETRGWGVRSLSSIPSGSFVCEYVGKLLRDEEAERSANDEYLFDIGHNYDDSALWAGLPGISSMTSAKDSGVSVSEGFTIDAAEVGNVGRFINHSCSPNLYAQNVLFDHDDKRMPHIMFFAAENIPPLEELTYHYNYSIGEVRDSHGNEKVKPCYCGSSDCDQRLY